MIGNVSDQNLIGDVTSAGYVRSITPPTRRIMDMALSFMVLHARSFENYIRTKWSDAADLLIIYLPVYLT